MIVFDRYLPETWVEQGLTLSIHHDPSEAESATVPTGKLRRFAKASVFAIGMALTSLPFSADVVIGGNIKALSASAFTAVPGDVTPGYWGKMAEVLRIVPTLPADDMSNDPLPLV
jgi:hypothetical protein